jgi:hypothetical protein
MSLVASDPALLTVARRVLARHDFRLREATLTDVDDAPWLLAESDYFVLGVAAGRTFDDLRVYEGYVASALGELLQEGEVGAKRWDSYVVLLATAGGDEQGRREVVDLQYNTRSLRRLVSLGTAAHEDAVTAALATFLPLPAPPPGGLPSAFDELVEQLVINGIPQDQVVDAVASYRGQGGADGG